MRGQRGPSVCAAGETSFAEIADDGQSITFQPCGTISYNPHDVADRYCARCHRRVPFAHARELRERCVGIMMKLECAACGDVVYHDEDDARELAAFWIEDCTLRDIDDLRSYVERICDHCQHGELR